ncbi:tyrosine-type recombinase/integrase [Puniceibacterium sediminis]|uniref:Phage integrase family protein n=1 Tax=Puniceibacterium sediminis TaxID=1608407 RepID=A0A238XSP0_9RHOB|nr:tyrosine-type recombinase/integrase [Puniceibacterium sediminis]SNR61588.1 Phage integrase family protein [Puniceibacterium sediminis]
MPTEDEISRFFDFYKPGTVPRNAVVLMLNTGAARVDAVKLGPSNIFGDRIVYVRQKTENTNGQEINIPIHPHLRQMIDRIPRGHSTFLQTNSGIARSEKGLGKDMRKWCNAAGLPQCSSHGLRRAIARRLAESGASPHEIMAVTGHKTLREVERYTRDANRAKMADDAMNKLSRSVGE